MITLPHCGDLSQTHQKRQLFGDFWEIIVHNSNGSFFVLSAPQIASSSCSQFRASLPHASNTAILIALFSSQSPLSLSINVVALSRGSKATHTPSPVIPAYWLDTHFARDLCGHRFVGDSMWECGDRDEGIFFGVICRGVANSSVRLCVCQVHGCVFFLGVY